MKECKYAKKPLTSACWAYMIPVLILPRILGMDGVWLSMAAGEILSLGMSLYYFRKYRGMWREEPTAG